jgi:hypothetical protein
LIGQSPGRTPGNPEGSGVSDDEAFVFAIAFGVAVMSMVATSVSGLHPLCLERNPGPGLVRLAILGGLAWIGIVLRYFGDPSIVGIYVWFYVVLGYAVIKFFGQLGGRMFGISMRADVAERRNWPAAIFLSAFTLGTGLIFGGSLWGEADPNSDYEGGWWIPMGFFLLGWGVMAGTTAIYHLREPGRFRTLVLQERDKGAAAGAASFTLSTAVLMTDAVSGDFFGWTAGLLDVAMAAAMLIAHEFLRTPTGIPEAAGTRRVIECAFYIVLALIGTLIWTS